MTEQKKVRLRGFEKASNQRHIKEEDRHLYKAPIARHHLAIIGTGTIGQEHMRVTSLLGRAKIHGIFDIESHSMNVAAKEFSRYDNQTLVPYESLDDLCADDRIDAILICTPNFTHFDLLKKIIQTGKPIFLEKRISRQAIRALFKSVYSTAIKHSMSKRFMKH